MSNNSFYFKYCYGILLSSLLFAHSTNAATFNVPSSGWLDRLQAFCDRNGCQNEPSERKIFNQCDSLTDFSYATEEKNGQDFGVDFLTWSEYKWRDGTICVKTQLPSVEFLNSDEASLLTAASLFAERGFTRSLQNLGPTTPGANVVDDILATNDMFNVNCIIDSGLRFEHPALVLPMAKLITANPGQCNLRHHNSSLVVGGEQGSGTYLTSRLVLTAAHVVHGGINCVVGGASANTTGQTKSKILGSRIMPGWTLGNSTVLSNANDVGLIATLKPAPSNDIFFPRITSYQTTYLFESVSLSGYAQGRPTRLAGTGEALSDPSCGVFTGSTGTAQNPLAPYIRALLTGESASSVRGASGGPILRNEAVIGGYVSRIVGLVSGAADYRNVPDKAVIFGPEISFSSLMSPTLGSFVTELQATYPQYLIQSNLNSSIWDASTVETISVTAGSFAKNSFGTTSIGNVFWVDENNVVLGTNSSLTLRGADFPNGDHQVSVGASASGPFGDTVHFEVQRPIGTFTPTSPVTCAQTGECMATANATTENAYEPKVFAMPSNTMVGRISQNGFQLFKVPSSTTRFELRHGSNGAYLLASATTTKIISNPGMSFPGGPTCALVSTQNCTVNFVKVRDTWPAYLDAEYFDGQYWKHWNNQTATTGIASLGNQQIPFRLTSGTGSNYTTVAIGYLLSGEVSIIDNISIGPRTCIALRNSNVNSPGPSSSNCEFLISWSPNPAPIIRYELQSRSRSNLVCSIGTDCWSSYSYVSIIDDSVSIILYKYARSNDPSIQREIQFRVRACIGFALTCSSWGESSVREL